MRSVFMIGLLMLLCVTGCATAGSRGSEGPTLHSMHRGGTLRLGPVQMGGDLSLIGGVYRTHLGGEPNP